MMHCLICGRPEGHCSVYIHRLDERAAKLEAMHVFPALAPPAEQSSPWAKVIGSMPDLPEPADPPAHDEACATRAGTSRNCDCGACEAGLPCEQPASADGEAPAKRCMKCRDGIDRQGRECRYCSWKTVPPTPAQGAPAEPLSKDINGWATHARVQELEARIATAERERDEAVAAERERCMAWIAKRYGTDILVIEDAIRDGRPAP